MCVFLNWNGGGSSSGPLPYFTGFYQRGGSSSGPSQDFTSVIEEKKSYTIKDLDIEDHLPASRRTYNYT